MKYFLSALLVMNMMGAVQAKDAVKDVPAKEAETTKESYIAKANEEVKEWSTKVQALEDRSKASGEKVRHALDRHLKGLHARVDEVRKGVQKLSGSGEGAWGSFRKGLEESLEKLRQDYDKAATTFKKTEKRVMEKGDK